MKVAKDEFEKVNKAKFKDILKSLTKETAKEDNDEEVTAPPKETVTGTISGVDIMELEDAVKVLWKNKLYAESGMGCTGPIIMVSEANLEKAIDILAKEGFITKESTVC